MEIERRWLVEGWPALAPSSVLQMDQGYFAVRPAIRIRREAVLGGETRYVLCFKGGAGLAGRRWRWTWMRGATTASWPCCPAP